MRVAITIPSDEGRPPQLIVLNLEHVENAMEIRENGEAVLVDGFRVADVDDFKLGPGWVAEVLDVYMHQYKAHCGAQFMKYDDALWDRPSSSSRVWSWALLPETHGDSVAITRQFPGHNQFVAKGV